MYKYDVAIIGAGISGIMAAYRLHQHNKNIKIALIDKGSLLADRKCPILSHQTLHCTNCHSCSIMNGFAGAGAFSDGKFIISTEYGGRLQDIIGHELTNKYMSLADNILTKYSGPQKVYIPNNSLSNLCEDNHLILKKGIVKHFGTENNLVIMQKLLDYLSQYCDFYPKSEVTSVDPIKKIININHRSMLTAKNIIFAVGRSGNKFLSNWCRSQNIGISNTNVDIGVRVEMKDSIWDEISSIAYDPKISYVTQKYNDETRMFCFNKGGHVVIENTFNAKTVNGHAYSNPQLKSENCNFALLSSIQFSAPFNNPSDYIYHIVCNANLISGDSVIIQRFGDLISGQRSTEEKIRNCATSPTLNAYPGDLSLCIPKRQLDNIIETLYQLDVIAPGTASDDTLLYGPEVKYYSSVPEMNNFQLAKYNNIYACGDGCGVTRSLAQAAANGLYVADIITV